MARKLLVVDDDVHLRKLVGMYLRDAGFDVRQAATGEEGLQLAGRERFDVVLVDLILPHYGGLRLCQKFKAMPSPPRVVITSGDDSQQARDGATESRADAFLPKPFTREQLLAAVGQRAPQF